MVSLNKLFFLPPSSLHVQFYLCKPTLKSLKVKVMAKFYVHGWINILWLGENLNWYSFPLRSLLVPGSNPLLENIPSASPLTNLPRHQSQNGQGDNVMGLWLNWKGEEAFSQKGLHDIMHPWGFMRWDFSGIVPGWAAYNCSPLS